MGMKITVVALASNTSTTTYTVDLEPCATVRDLKTQIHEKHPCKVPTKQQLILFPTTSLQDHDHYYSSPYGPLLPFRGSDTCSLQAQCSITDGSTIYLTLLLRVLVADGSNPEREVFVDLKWKYTLGNLRDHIKELTRIPVHNQHVTWGTVKFGPYQESTLESLCDLWTNPTQAFLVAPSSDSKGKKAVSSDFEDGQLDTDSEEERAKESDYNRPGAMFCSEHRRKHNEVGPLCDKRRTGSFFGLQFRKAGVKSVVDALDSPGTSIPMPEALLRMEIVKDPEIKFVILWLGGGLEEMLTRFEFHRKKDRRCVVVKGERDLSTYCFLRKLKADFRTIPICAVTDCDPCSLKVLTFLRHPLSEFPPKLQRQFGAKWKETAAVYGAKIEIKWIGVRPSYNMFSQLQTFPMTRKNVQTAKEFLEEDGFVGMFPEWAEELKLMLASNETAKIEALAGLGNEYFSSVFLLEELGKHRCSGVKFNRGRR